MRAFVLSQSLVYAHSLYKPTQSPRKKTFDQVARATESFASKLGMSRDAEPYVGESSSPKVAI
jgi:hypothetical protein